MSRSYKNSEPLLPIMQGSPPPTKWQLPLRDWDRAPWNRWTFQNIRTCVPTEEIACGETALQWEIALQDLTKVDFTSFGGTLMNVADFLDGYIDGFLVAHRGHIIHESYHNGMTRQTLHLAMSVSKSITSTIAGILIEQEKIDPAELVTTYVPELSTTGWEGATLQQVLDMTTGVSFEEDYDDPDCDIARLEVAAAWKPRPEGIDTLDWPDTTWDLIMALKECDAVHGERFHYRSIETDLLGILISRVAGQTLAQAISENLWRPMGAETTANITVDWQGTALADGGISATLRDFARFGQTLLDDGRAGNRQVIPKAWIDDIRSGDHGRFDNKSREFMPNGLYRNMFWIRDETQPTHMSLGIYGQFIYVAPEQDLVVVCLSTWPDALSEEGHSNTIRAIDAIALEIC
jgi:CubicO group peptidase (beta-lactamase class C family)